MGPLGEFVKAILSKIDELIRVVNPSYRGPEPRSAMDARTERHGGRGKEKRAGELIPGPPAFPVVYFSSWGGAEGITAPPVTCSRTNKLTCTAPIG